MRTRIDTRIASSASNDPVIHLVLFIPSSKHSPLHIFEEGVEGRASISPSNAFLLPQWGGIVLLNPSSATPNPLPRLGLSDLDSIFNTFAYQLLTLLGVPGLPPSVRSVAAKADGPQEPFTDWELDALLRRRAIENVWGSTETLESIVRLVDQIESMPVGQDVRGDIQDALAALDDVRLPPFFVLCTWFIQFEAVEHQCILGARDGPLIAHRCPKEFRTRTDTVVARVLQPGHACPALLPSRTQVRRVHAAVRLRRRASRWCRPARDRSLAASSASCATTATATRTAGAEEAGDRWSESRLDARVVRCLFG